MKTKEVKNNKKNSGDTDNPKIHVHTTNDFFFENETYSVIKNPQNYNNEIQ